MLKITLEKSLIAHIPEQALTIKALGLKKTNSVVYHEDTPQIRGMIKKVAHLIKVEEVEEAK